MQHSREARILLLGKRSSKVKRVEGILKKYALDAQVVSETGHLLRPSVKENFKLIVVTDALEDTVGVGFMQGVRDSFPNAKLVSIFDDIIPEIEINMRSAGVVFLGSYDHFFREAGDILKSAFGPKKME